MTRKSLFGMALASLAMLAGNGVRAQSYSNAVLALNPAAYWPLNETAQPPQVLNITATNLGSLGMAGNGFYGAWYAPSGPTWYLTNNIVQTNSITYPYDGSKVMFCQQSVGQYIVVPRNASGKPNPSLTVTAPFSIELWTVFGATNSANRPLVSQGQVPVVIGGPDTNNPYYGGTSTAWAGFALGQYQDYFYFDVYNTNANNKPAELQSSAWNTFKGPRVGQWTHVVVTFDGTNSTMYTNGIKAASATVSPNGAGVRYVPDPTSPLMIGSGNVVALTGGMTTDAGALGEIAVYPTALGSDRVKTHFETAYGTNATYGHDYTNAVLSDGPTLYYRLNDSVGQVNGGYPSGTFPVATNYGWLGAAANGVFQPGTTPGVTGPTNLPGFGTGSRAVAFNGWLGGVDVGGGNLPAALNPTGATPLTLVSWFQTGPADSPGRFQEIVGHGDSSYRMALGQATGENHFNPGPGPELQLNTPSVDVAVNHWALNDGKWHMTAGVSDGTNEFLYLDGVLVQSNSNSGGLRISGNTNDLMIGGDSQYTYASAGTANTLRFLDGQVAQVAYWTNALSAAQIQQLFSAAGAPPVMHRQPVSATLSQGQNLTNFTFATGASPLGYQWYQNGSPVAGQTNANLTLTPALTSQAGSYFVVATNAYGTATSAVVQLTIYGPPQIQQQMPTQIQVFAGTSPNLSVVAQGAQPIYYFWRSNNVLVATTTNGSYTITNIQSTANYDCLVSNLVSTTTMSTVSITVLPAPTAPYPMAVLADKPAAYFRLNESDQGGGNNGVVAHDYAGGYNAVYTNVALGLPGYNPMRFGQANPSDPANTCAEFGDFSPYDANNFAGNGSTLLNFATPNGGNAQFSVEAWFARYFPGNTNGIVTLGYGNGGEQFMLDLGAGSGAGTLRFLVRNAAGTTSAANGANAYTDSKWHHAVGVCDEAGGHLYLYVDGVQVANGTITAGSGVLSSSTPLSIGARQSGNLNPPVYDNQFEGQISDVAIYRQALSSAQVLNHYMASGLAPAITQLLPGNQWTTNQGATATFTAAATGTAPLSYQWTDNNGANIPWGTSLSLSLTNLQPNQQGTYTLTVTSPYGTATTNLYLSLNLGPATLSADLQPLNITCYAGASNTYSVVAAGTAPFSYQWYLNGAKIANATNAAYNFAALAGTNTYFCAVSNVYSYSQGSGPVYSSTGRVVGVTVPTLNPSDYSCNLKITFSGYNRTDMLTNFPVLVKLGTNVAGFAYSQFASAAGADLRFTDQSGTRELPYEVNQWNPAGISTFWVQVPSLYSNAVIWAYWGNPANTTPEAWTTNGEVWVPAFQSSPAFDLVWHLEQSAAPYLDSTSNYPGTSVHTPAQGTGLVGEDALFNGNNTDLSAGIVNPGKQFTLSAWVNLSAGENNIQGIWAGYGGGNTNGYRFYVNSWNNTDGKVVLETGDNVNAATVATAGGLVGTNQWHMISAAIDQNAATAQLYVDGSLQASGAIISDFVNTNPVNLGSFVGGFWWLRGALDEARIRDTTNSASWEWASWATVAQNATFATNSSVSTTLVSLTYQMVNGKLVLSWPQGVLESATQVSGPYSSNGLSGATSPYTNTVSGSQNQFFRVKVR